MSLKEKIIESSLKKNLGDAKRLTYPSHILTKDYNQAIEAFKHARDNPEKVDRQLKIEADYDNLDGAEWRDFLFERFFE